MQQCRRKGFTLIELLVVVGIMVLLMSILMPALGRARESAKRTQCMANLHSIGQAIRAYMSESNDFYPPMAPMPSDTEAAAGREVMSKILAPYVGNETKVFHCPSDRIMDPGENKPTNGETTWFDWQGSSYEPRALLSTVIDTGTGKCWLLSQEYRSATSRLPNPGSDMEKWNQLAEDLPRMVLVHDYENFHGEKNQPNNRMALYADFHVASMDESQTEKK